MNEQHPGSPSMTIDDLLAQSAVRRAAERRAALRDHDDPGTQDAVLTAVGATWEWMLEVVSRTEGTASPIAIATENLLDQIDNALTGGPETTGGSTLEEGMAAFEAQMEAFAEARKRPIAASELDQLARAIGDAVRQAITHDQAPATRSDSMPPLLTRRDLCAFLGISKSSLHRRMKEPGFPTGRLIGGGRRWRPEDLEAFVAKKPRKEVGGRA